jgi:TonB-dependent receptor
MFNSRVTGSRIKASLLTGACLVAMSTASAVAQQNPNEIETIVSTGLISSLQRNLDITRDAPGLVDAISAEDMGKFPDVDIAAALQHVPGVTVSRASNGTQTGITVRGFGPQFNQTLQDGRKASSASGRTFDFSTVGADFVSRVDVNKTPDASLSSGAIGATVNIIYPKPFDHPGFRMAASASTTATDNLGQPQPNADIVISDTFDGDRFGILLAGAYSSVRTRDNHLNTNGWQGNYLDPCQLAGAAAACGATLTPDTTKPIWYMQEYQLFQDNETETRYDGRLAMQWRPADSVVVTLDDNYSRHMTGTQQYGYSAWFNQGSLRNVQTSQYGTVTNFVQPGSPTDLDSSLGWGITESNQYGLNVAWQASEKLGFVFDAAQGETHTNPGNQLTSIGVDVGYGPSKPAGTNGADIGILVPGGHALPYPVNFGPNNNQSQNINNGMIGSHVLTMSQAGGLDKLQQFRAAATWTENDDLTFTAGYQYVGQHHNSVSYDDFANNAWQAYSGYGAASNNYYPVDMPGAPSPNCPASANGGNPCPAGAALPQNLFTQSIPTSGFISGWTQTAIPPALPKYDARSVLNYLQSLGNPQAGFIPGANTTCCNPAYTGTYNVIKSVSSVEQVIENTNAIFVQMALGTKIAGMPLKINLGVRQEFTDLTTVGIGRLPTQLAVQAADHTAFTTTFTPTSNVEGHNNYQYLLPNLDLALSVTDELQIRLDASRTLTRPSLGQITPVLNVPVSPRVGALTASGGNPGLMPYLSDNLDLAANYYYAQNSYVGIDVFSKNVSNFIVAGTTQQSINGVIDPTTGAAAIYTISANVNGPSANVYGAEVGWQHVFDDTGFGFQANGTVVGTNKPYDPTDLSKSGFAVTGLADSANLVGFYDKDGFQARVAVTWNDTVLDRFGQTQNNSKFGAEPTFVNANTHIDFSTSYDFTPQLNVYFTAQNLTNATMSTHGRWPDQVLDVFDYGRRFTIGLHYRY